jgi:glutamyl-tRNA synthetase
MKQFVEWFSLEAVSASASRFNQEKFLWLNAQRIKAADNSRLAALIARAWLPLVWIPPPVRPSRT